ncbi:polyphosphate kinase 1 [Chitinophagaceae bacterium LB-8]|uniref:Polyphosphate kinase n=1 Tax=Paraflavisolibacter caeni TaxID=2982496 RepID=A0A9X2Y0J8_9BACT|nr:polyphosphate kinase 1 [Paraflavisolibacter caeni]MCU7552167.1 polyphosphate kinase 1 [Paraflavisolibacter caeni]
MSKYSFFNRDISWLSFNERVLLEASKTNVPIMERIKFLSIYSSNLDEFYRIRMPALMALHKLHKKDNIQKSVKRHYPDIEFQVKGVVQLQLDFFGKVLTQQLIPSLKETGFYLLYDEPIPDEIKPQTTEYFFSEILAFLQIVNASRSGQNFFPENNKLYLAIIVEGKNGEEFIIVNVPSSDLPRFYSVKVRQVEYIVFIEDIIKENIGEVLKDYTVKACFNLKITRDAELNIDDEFSGDIADKIEKQIQKRDFGLATRFLYEPVSPMKFVNTAVSVMRIPNAIMVRGGRYHNLKDLLFLPIKASHFSYPKMHPISLCSAHVKESLLLQLLKKDIIIHTPFHSYNPVLRFFNEASIDESVEEIAVTLYRVASDSRIANALISAAKNGKKVSVFVELKARFDEANNLKWSKKMKEAGIKIIYSIPTLKVHAKIALVKMRKNEMVKFFGLLATGNFNESTARYYTDHILLTSNSALLQEAEMLFHFLSKREKPTKDRFIPFNFLLVGQFNLIQRFIDLIDNEIENAKNGRPAKIIIKLNNLEEKVLISKLYDASNAGVKIFLLVRSICCLIPGISGMSENITVRRIVDRYLEHGRVFIFHNNGKEDVYLGSADWMNRNIYRRIEVCFPIYDEAIKQELIKIINIQLQDNTQAVLIDDALRNNELFPDSTSVRSQEEIYNFLTNKNHQNL